MSKPSSWKATRKGSVLVLSRHRQQSGGNDEQLRSRNTDVSSITMDNTLTPATAEAVTMPHPKPSPSNVSGEQLTARQTEKAQLIQQARRMQETQRRTQQERAIQQERRMAEARQIQQERVKQNAQRMEEAQRIQQERVMQHAERMAEIRRQQQEREMQHAQRMEGIRRKQQHVQQQQARRIKETQRVEESRRIQRERRMQESRRIQEIQQEIEMSARMFEVKFPVAPTPTNTPVSVQPVSHQIMEFELVFQQYNNPLQQQQQQTPRRLIPSGNITSSPSTATNSNSTTALMLPAEKQVVLDQARNTNEIKEEDEGKQCVVCLERTKSHILIPCGHFAYCEQCANSLKICALCRRKVTKRIKVYES